jgi:lipoprotein
MKKKYHIITAWVAFAALAFGLSGCTADDVTDNGNDGKGLPSDNVSFVALSQPEEKTSAKTRLGAEELNDRIRFRWTSGDWQYLYCDVTPLASAPTWKKSKQQYALEVDPNNPKFYKSTAFVFPDIKPLYTCSNDSWSRARRPTAVYDGSSMQYKTDGRSIGLPYDYYSLSNGGYYSNYLSQHGTQSTFYPIIFTGSGNANRVNVRRDQRQGGAYPDSLAYNGACFVGYAFANGVSAYSMRGGYTETQNKDYNSYTDYTWKQYTLYFGNSNNYTNSEWRKLLPTYLDINGNTSYDTNGMWQSTVYNVPASHGTMLVAGHKTSYVSVMPYNPKGQMSNVNVKAVRIDVDNQAINGIHNFSVAGIDLSNRGSHILNTYKWITLSIDDGLTVARTREEAREKAAIITALPGEYTGVKVTLSFKDQGTGVTLAKEQKYGSLKVRLEEGQNLPIYYKLDVTSFNQMFNTYHMWGSVATYWPPLHTFNDWVFNGTTGSKPAPTPPNDTWPKDNTDAGQRWYNDFDFMADPTSLDGDAPTSNDISYVIDKCYWDDQTVYLYDGHLFKGLIWVPYITKNKTTAKDGTDWTSVAPTTATWNYAGTGPHNVAGYFALPALGYWEDGALKDVGKEGRYWLIDGAAAGDYDHAYSIQFNKNGIKLVYDTPRKHGYMAMPTTGVNN